MRKFFNRAAIFMAALSLGLGFAGCSDDDNDDKKPAQTVDATQQAIVSNYVNEIVVPTYKSLADASIKLADACADLSSQEKVNQACAHWVEARKYWELSEAFLYGAAADYNIDPHIDSWPLDLGQLSAVLKAGDIEARISAGTAGYGLLGFHAVEYVIFKNGETGDASNRVRNHADITDAEKTFAAAVAADMRDQCIRLEAAWAGVDKVSAAKQKMLAEAELEPTMNYGELLASAGMPGNAKYKTQAAAFEEILVGASDIANEVGNTKISDPMASHQWSDVESPHSWNSVTDFADNIRSVRNAYLGTRSGERAKHSVSAHVASIDMVIDMKVQTAIDAAIKACEAMPKPFRNYIFENTDAASKDKIKAAIEACNALRDALDEAQEAVKK